MKFEAFVVCHKNFFNQVFTFSKASSDVNISMFSSFLTLFSLNTSDLVISFQIIWNRVLKIELNNRML